MKQPPGQPVTQGGREPRQGEKSGGRDLQILPAVNPDQNPPAEKLLPEIIAIGIHGTGGVIQRTLNPHGLPRLQSLRNRVGIKSPIGASGQRHAVQGDMSQGGPDLTVLPELNLPADDAGNLTGTFRRQGRMIRKKAPEGSQGQHCQKAGEKTAAAVKKPEGGEGADQTGGAAPPGSGETAQQNAQRQTYRRAGQEPSPKTGGHS